MRTRRSVPADQRAATGLIAGNYGEAGALDKFGARLRPAAGAQWPEPALLLRAATGLGHNALLVGHDVDDPIEHTGFASCTVVGTLDNKVDVDNEEQGRQILYCSGRNLPWARSGPPTSTTRKRARPARVPPRRG